MRELIAIIYRCAPSRAQRELVPHGCSKGATENLGGQRQRAFNSAAGGDHGGDARILSSGISRLIGRGPASGMLTME
jgi:hypothetical protein